MELIDIFEFRERFRAARSIAVIGNSPSILDYDNGGRIDEHDLIFRFNRAYTDGIEKQVGSRTDVLVVNQGKTPKRSAPPAETVRPACVVCLCPMKERADLAILRSWVGDVPLVITAAPDLVDIGAVARTRPLTSGTYLLYTLLRLFEPERLFLTGFTMYGAVPGGAEKYFEQDDARDAVRLGTYHDIDQEARIFAEIVSRFRCELEVTPEVAALLERNGVKQLGQATETTVTGVPPRRLPPARRALGRIAWYVLRAGMWLRRKAEHGWSKRDDLVIVRFEKPRRKK